MNSLGGHILPKPGPYCRISPRPLPIWPLGQPAGLPSSLVEQSDKCLPLEPQQAKVQDKVQ